MSDIHDCCESSVNVEVDRGIIVEIGLGIISS